MSVLQWVAVIGGGVAGPQLCCGCGGGGVVSPDDQVRLFFAAVFMVVALAGSAMGEPSYGALR